MYTKTVMYTLIIHLVTRYSIIIDLRFSFNDGERDDLSTAQVSPFGVGTVSLALCILMIPGVGKRFSDGIRKTFTHPYTDCRRNPIVSFLTTNRIKPDWREK